MAANSSLAKMLAIICLNLILVALVNSQNFPAGSPVLTPPYFNLAYERRVSATSTCGEGNVAEERFCKLTGADPTEGHNEGSVIEGGQLCDVCLSPERAERLSSADPRQRAYYEGRVHSPAYAVDGSERWWQSPPLSRGLQYSKVNLTVDLGQVSASELQLTKFCGVGGGR